MAVPGSGSPLLFSADAGAPGGFAIERSLRFNSADSAYLNRTPASAGNRKTWTWSGWVKKSKLKGAGGDYSTLFAAGTNNFVMRFDTSEALEIYDYSGGFIFNYVTSAVYRDLSAWFHVVLAVDTTNGTASDRVKLYINGSRVTTFSTATNPSLNADGTLNTTVAHYIGRASNGIYYDGYLADVYLIDGSALDPTSFGEFDTNGVWQPIAYSGSYGTNGFHLDFADNSSAAALGYDAAGSNDWTVNNITADNPTTLPAVAFDGSGDYLSLASSADFEFGTGDFTVEAFVCPTTTSTNGMILASGDGEVSGQWYLWSNGGTWNFGTYVSNIPGNRIIGGAITANAWTHLAVVKSGNDFKLYINGTQSGSTYTGSGSYGPSGYTLSIGRQGTAGNDFTGFISNVRVIKGTAFYTSNFTRPSAPLSAVTNTKLLCCQSSSSTTAAAVSPGTITANGNVYATTLTDSQPGNDSLRDSPTNGSQTDTGVGGEVVGNYCTLNAIDRSSSITPTNGNLTASDGTNVLVRGTIFVSSGKWYYECTATTVSGAFVIGVATNQASLSYLGVDAFGWGYTGAGGGLKYNAGGSVGYGSGISSGDVIGVAIDMDAKTLVFYKNNTSLGTAFSNLTGAVAPAFSGGSGSTCDFNFGARSFAYTAPSGFKALCTTNLPTPTIEDPSTVMDVALYTGNSNNATTIACGFQPDLVWIKNRTNGDLGVGDHMLFDQLRGVQNYISSNRTDAEVNNANALQEFTTNGFKPGSMARTNATGYSYAAWTWDAGSSTATNNSGSISSQVRANISAGFSIVTWTGTSASGTIGHGLGVKPHLIIGRRRNGVANWCVYHISTGASQGLSLNSTDAAFANTSRFDGVEPTSTVFSVGSSGDINAGDALAYCFAPVASYSSFGSYVGNGGTDGPFVYTGFKPRWVLLKSSSAAGWNWHLRDTARDIYNPVQKRLFPDTSSAESDNDSIDILSNGFKLRTLVGDLNGSGTTYVWAAFAEHPFQTARAR